MEDHIKKSNFEYLNGDSVDDELKCSICFQAFCSPVCNPQCGHTFCQQCIKTWHKNSSICPTCRQRAYIKNYAPVQTRAVLNQLSRLLIKCNLCQQINIEDRDKHLEICPKQIIQCTSADIHCQWKGKREDFLTHLEICSFQQIRPIINQLIEEIKIIKETQHEQQRFIQAFINNGYTLSRLCSTGYCHFTRPPIDDKLYVMSCSLCNKQIDSKTMGLHSCITNTCICKLCLDKHTPQQSLRLTRKRKLSLDEESNDDYDNGYACTPRSRSPSPF
jgi:hypothetical protein